MRPLQEVEKLPIDLNNDNLEEITNLDVEELEDLEEEAIEVTELDIDELDDGIIGIDELEEEVIDEIIVEKKETKLKAHIIRRNIEDYLEKKALERRLSDVFDTDYYFD